MTGRIGRWRASGPADPRRAAMAGWLDAVVSLVVTMLVWPFPLVRALAPLPVHVMALVVAILLVDTLYRFVGAMLWGRTPVMYLLDLGLSDRIPPPTAAAARWAIGWTLALIPSLAGVRRLVHPTTGLPERLSGLKTVAARPR